MYFSFSFSGHIFPHKSKKKPILWVKTKQSFKKAAHKRLVKWKPCYFWRRAQESKNKAFQQESEQSECQTEKTKGNFVKPACSFHVWISLIDIAQGNVFHLPTIIVVCRRTIDFKWKNQDIDLIVHFIELYYNLHEK